MQTLQYQNQTCTICGNRFASNRSDTKYCKDYCRLKAFRQRHGIHQQRADRELRNALAGVSSGRLTAPQAKARLDLILLNQIPVEKTIRKMIENL